MKSKLLVVFVCLFSLSANARLAPRNSDDGSRVTYDIGVSSGKSNDVTYTEYNLGLNWWWSRSIAWRNSFFGRSQEGEKTTYGLDTSIRGNIRAELGEESSLNIFLGPGYRFVNEGKNAPIAEAGAVLKLGGLSLGGGAKMVFNSAIDKTLEDDVQYFIVLGGGGTL